ncbi:uncharacterized protein LOC106150473 [Lingula anatina]|uniref:Uncharacterized protein LOC106150473 n=1 Tax=Lingula anatina TaxID=7574 RepID=A0A1S3H0V7_LINAN|nr:uncharacterized protein LOC106150473 [Lingula anatina]|eukprot:XP_013378779.1 uncharacterized protein LOC106150473 [Lingula anatina]
MDPTLMAFLKGNLTRLIRSQINLYTVTQSSYQTYVNQPRVAPYTNIDPKTADPGKLGGWYFPRDTCAKLFIQTQTKYLEGEVKALAVALNSFHHDLTAYKLVLGNVSMLEYRRLCNSKSGCPTDNYQCGTINDDNSFYCTSLGDVMKSVNDSMFFLRRTLSNFNTEIAGNHSLALQVKFVRPQKLSDFVTSVYTQLALYNLQEITEEFKDCMLAFFHVFSVNNSDISLF